MIIDGYGPKNKNCTKVELLTISSHISEVFFRVMVGFPKLGHCLSVYTNNYVAHIRLG